MGLSAVPWTVNAEIFPLDVRTVAIAQSTAFNWLLNSAVAVSFLPLVEWLGTGPTFLGYALAAASGGMWLFWNMPETNSLSLEQITPLFAGGFAGIRHAKSRGYSTIG